MNSDPSAKAGAWPVFRALSGETPGALGRDLAAGLTLAAIAVPEQMATARLGGFAPEIGLFAFVAASLGFAALGSNRRLSAGADSTITPIFAGSLALMAATGSAQYATLAAGLALMVGLLLIIGGVLKLGWIADLLSLPVLTGFLAGIALHILLSQLPSVLGLPEGSGNVYHRLASLWREAHRINPPSLAIGLVVFAAILLLEKLAARIPGALIAVVAATLATAALHLERQGVAVLGAVHGGFPSLHLPTLTPANVAALGGLALVVTLVVMVQTAATTRSFSGEEGGEDGDPDVARDYIGMGFSSVLAGLVGAFPVDASPPRTAIAAEAGAASQFTGLAAALVVLFLAAFGGPLLAYVPTAALGGVLLFVAQRIFRVGTLATILRRSPAEFVLAILTMVLIVALPIQTGAAIGIFLSLAHGVFTTTRARPVMFERAPGTTVWWPASSAHPGETEPGVMVMGFQAPLSFLNAYDFRRGVLQAIDHRTAGTRLFVLEASSIIEIDFTASTILSAVIARVKAAGLAFAVARLESVRAQAAFDRFGVAAALGPDHMFQSVEAAIRALAARDAGVGVAPSGSREAEVRAPIG
jgi:MFS superfamily sulfate permease-like transporter